MIVTKKHTFLYIITLLFSFSLEAMQRTNYSTPYTTQEIQKILVHAPQQLLELTHNCKPFLHGVMHKLLVKSKHSPYDTRKMLHACADLFDDMANPTCFINECPSAYTDCCPLQRSVHTIERDAFENQVSEKLVDEITKNDAPVNYVAFGPGRLFSELVILTKTLTQKPDAQINFHCIDPSYLDYIQIKNQLTNNDDASITEQRFDVVLFNKYVNKKYDLGNFVDREICFMQFKRIINKMFPKACVAMFIHTSHTQYMNYVQKNNMSLPDMIVGSDISDPRSLTNGSIRDFIQLCINTMQIKNNMPYNAIYAKERHNYNVNPNYYALSADIVAQILKHKQVMLNADIFQYLKCTNLS